jgi:pimeloyl-ACP methyl ester carboxylesterase
MVTRRVFLAGVGGAAVFAGCGSSNENADVAEAVPKTFVLVHGAWHGGWCWSRVADRLRARGHHVLTPTQTGLGERSHLLSDRITLGVFIDDMANVLEWEDLSEVILVGHSSGGISVTGVADRLPGRVSRLVYLDSHVLQDGQSVFSVLPPEVAAARRKAADEFSGGVSLPPPDPSSLGVVEPADVEWVKQKCTPHPRSTYEDPLRLKNPVGNGLPVTYVAVKPEFAPTASSRAFAKEQTEWQYLEIDAGHDAMVTSPETLVDLLADL